MKPSSPRTRLIPLALAMGLALATAAVAQSTSTSTSTPTSTPPSEAERRAAETELKRATSELERAQRELAAAAERAARSGLATPLPAEARARTIALRLSDRPVLGVVLAPDAESGLRIEAVTPDSGAAKAGVRSGDRVVAIDGATLAGSDGDARLADARRRLLELDVKRAVALTIERAGKRSVLKVTPQPGDRLALLDTLDPMLGARLQQLGALDGTIAGLGDGAAVDGAVIDGAVIDVIRRRGAVDAPTREQRIVRTLPPGVAPQVHREIIRLGGANTPCAGDDCRLPLLAEAFRWNGLHLASIDATLGRYFGTERGVLVLSPGEDLGTLQAGDVIQRIDGKAVATPREAMGALRARPADSRVAVDYLRDRKAATAQVTVPKARALSLLVAPPAPPTPPSPPSPARPALPATPATPAPPPSPPSAPTPPAPAPAPAPAHASVMLWSVML